MECHFQVGAKAFGVFWDDASLDDVITGMFSPWQTGNGRPERKYTVERTGSGYLLRTPGAHMSRPDREMLAAEVEHTLTSAFLECFESQVLLHASSIDLDGNGALVIGPHGAGKTTFALAALCRGFRALGDDVAVVGEDLLHAQGFPRPFRVTPGTLALTPGVIPADCPRLPIHEIITYVFFTFPPEKYFTPSTRLRHILFPVRQDGPAAVRALGTTEALTRILSQGFNFDRRIGAITGDLVRLLKQAAPLEIVYEDHWEAVEAVRRLLS
ncbi:MAG: hypothetical protein ACYC9O_19765 [Candidatus Latescibacterota bacterium]